MDCGRVRREDGMTGGHGAMERRPAAIVTGAGSGIGRATAVALAGAGWRVALVGRRDGPLRETAAIVEEGAGGRGASAVVVGDVGAEADAAKIVDSAVRAFGRLDALVNNAGFVEQRTLAEHDAGQLRAIFEINALGPIRLMAAALPALRASGRDRGGVIVNISSRAAHDPFPGLGVYGSAKAAVEAACRAVAGEETAVRAYAIAPGAVETPMLRGLFDEAMLPRSATLRPEDIAREVLACVDGTTDLANGGWEIVAAG
jgi:NAD(P)-dependent dehydrogenase (short-subunit alcohol dehydrogenase family)